MFFDHNDVNFNTQLSLIKYCMIFENSVRINKVTLSSKKSYLTKYYHVNCKLTAFKNFLLSPLIFMFSFLKKSAFQEQENPRYLKKDKNWQGNYEQKKPLKNESAGCGQYIRTGNRIYSELQRINNGNKNSNN